MPSSAAPTETSGSTITPTSLATEITPENLAEKSRLMVELISTLQDDRLCLAHFLSGKAFTYLHSGHNVAARLASTDNGAEISRNAEILDGMQPWVTAVDEAFEAVEKAVRGLRKSLPDDATWAVITGSNA